MSLILWKPVRAKGKVGLYHWFSWNRLLGGHVGSVSSSSFSGKHQGNGNNDNVSWTCPSGNLFPKHHYYWRNPFLRLALTMAFIRSHFILVLLLVACSRKSSAFISTRSSNILNVSIKSQACIFFTRKNPVYLAFPRVLPCWPSMMRLVNQCILLREE